MYTRRPDDRQPPRPPENYSGTFLNQLNPPRQDNDCGDRSQDRDCKPEDRQPDRDRDCDDRRQPDRDCDDRRQSDRDCDDRRQPDRDCDDRRQPDRDCDDRRQPVQRSGRSEICRDEQKSDRGGLIGSLFGRLRNLELDDLLLLGLFFLIANDRDGGCENSDDLLLILGLLFFMGF